MLGGQVSYLGNKGCYEYHYHANGADELYHNIVKELGAELLLAQHYLLLYILGLYGIADEYAGEERQYRHHYVVGGEVKEVQYLHTEQLELRPYAESQN